MTDSPIVSPESRKLVANLTVSARKAGFDRGRNQPDDESNSQEDESVDELFARISQLEAVERAARERLGAIVHDPYCITRRVVFACDCSQREVFEALLAIVRAALHETPAPPTEKVK